MVKEQALTVRSVQQQIETFPCDIVARRRHMLRPDGHRGKLPETGHEYRDSITFDTKHQSTIVSLHVESQCIWDAQRLQALSQSFLMSSSCYGFQLCTDTSANQQSLRDK